MKETIAWVKEQLFQGWKCIVVDYGRIDSTHEAVEEMAKAYNNESMYDALCVKLNSKTHEPMTYHQLNEVSSLICLLLMCCAMWVLEPHLSYYSGKTNHGKAKVLPVTIKRQR